MTNSVLHSYVQDEYIIDEIGESLRIEDVDGCFRQPASPETEICIFDGGNMNNCNR